MHVHGGPFTLLVSVVSLLSFGCAPGDSPRARPELTTSRTPLVSQTGTLVATATVFEDRTGENGGASTDLCVGSLAGASSARRGFFRFDLPAIPTGSTVTRVVLTLNQVNVRRMGDGPSAATLYVRRVTAAWDEGNGASGGGGPCASGSDVAGVDWAGAPSVAGARSAEEALSAASGVDVVFDTDVGTNDDGLIADVQSAVDGGGLFGWRLRLANESASDTARRMRVVSLRVDYQVANGQACSQDSDCTSGQCVAPDGTDCGGAGGCVCCDAATCEGGCESCHISGSEGSCELRAMNEVCSAASCTNGSQSSQVVCDGVARTCGSPTVTDCAPYACAGTNCRATCTFNSHCLDGRCNELNQCIPNLADGVACAGDEECSSGHCVDDVCCDLACDGMCEACAEPASVGTCTAVTSGPECAMDDPDAGEGADADAGALGEGDAGGGEVDAGLDPVVEGPDAGDREMERPVPADGGEPSDEEPPDTVSAMADGGTSASGGDEGCGCSVPGRRRPIRGWAALGLAGLIGLRLRRRRTQAS